MLPTACEVLYRWLAGLCGCDSSKATSGRQKAKADNQSHRAIQLYVETKDLSVGQKIALLFQEVGKSHRCHQVFHLPLQSRKSITCIALPNLEHYLNFGILSTRLDRFDLAESAFEKAISLAPRRAEGYRELAELYLRANHELADARKLAEKAVEIKPDAQSYYVLAWACDMNGVHDQALDALERAMKLNPADAKYRQMYDLIKKKAITR